MCVSAGHLGKIRQDGASCCGLLVIKLVVKRKFLSTKDFYSSQPIPIGGPSDEKGSPILANNPIAFSYSAS